VALTRQCAIVIVLANSASWCPKRSGHGRLLVIYGCVESKRCDAYPKAPRSVFIRILELAARIDTKPAPHCLGNQTLGSSAVFPLFSAAKPTALG
jgi:hypothetical protein